MARNNNQQAAQPLESAVEASATDPRPQPTRELRPPDQSELEVPDTAEQPPKLPLAVEFEQTTVEQPKSHQAAPSHRHQGLEEAISSSEPSVTVKPCKNFSAHIGNNRWDFIKDVAVRVPQSVKEVLANARAIYP